MPTPKVIDLSHHNVIPKDLLATRNAGIIGVIHKLTEGIGYVDDKVQARWYLTMEAGMKWGLYHFMRPGNMEDQAVFFVDQAENLGILDDDTCLVADHEDENVSGEELKRFLDTVEDLTRRSPIVYSGHVLKEQLAGSGYRPKRRLWLCQYTSGTPSLPEGVDKYWMWQYTQEGTIPGVTPPTDLNDIGDVSEEEFLSGWAGRHEAIPEPPPVEKPRLTISSNVPITLRVGPNIEIC